MTYEYMSGMGDAAVASRLFTQGVEQFDAGHFNSAAQNFIAAHAEEPHPNALWNAAASYEEANAPQRAVEQYSRFAQLAESRTWSPPASHSAADARAKIAELGGSTSAKGVVEQVVDSVVGVFSKTPTSGSRPAPVTKGGAPYANQFDAYDADLAHLSTEQIARDEAASLIRGSVSLPTASSWFRSPTAYVVGGVVVIGIAGAAIWYLTKE